MKDETTARKVVRPAKPLPAANFSVHNGLELGEHNSEVFNELGFDEGEGERMGARGVIPKPATSAQAA